jgi:hypothetical protein
MRMINFLLKSISSRVVFAGEGHRKLLDPVNALFFQINEPRSDLPARVASR